jgi:hypothetical protein
MFVCWQWFEYTCIALSDMGRLATHKEVMTDYIVTRGIDRLRMTMVDPTPGMTRVANLMRTLDIRMKDAEAITSYRNFNTKDLSISSAGSVKGMVCGKLPYCLKNIELRNVIFGRDSRDDAARTVGISHSLNSLILDNVDIPLFVGCMRGLENLRVLKIPGMWIDDDDVLAIPYMTRLVELDISVSDEIDETIRFPDTLQKLRIDGCASIYLSNCTRLKRLELHRSGLFMGHMLMSAVGLPAIRCLRVTGLGPVFDAMSSMAVLSSIEGLTTLRLAGYGWPLHLMRHVKSLRSLDVCVGERNDLEFLVSITSLERLVVEVYGDARCYVDHVARMSNLKTLHISSTPLRGPCYDMTRVIGMRGLEDLSIYHRESMDKISLRRVHEMTGLRKLRLSLSELTLQQAENISRATTLEHLDISTVVMAERDHLYVLRRLPRLRKLILCGDAKLRFDLPDYCETCECFV